MGGGASGSRAYSRQKSAPTLLPEQKKVWDFLLNQLIPQAMGRETAATQIATQRARDEAASIANLQQQQIAGAATQGIGSGQRARLLSQSQDMALQNTLKNIIAQRQGAQQQAMGMLAGLPIAPGQASKGKSSSFGWAAQGGFWG